MRTLSLVLLTLLAAGCDSNDLEMAFGDAINDDGTACVPGELAVETLEPNPSGQVVQSPRVTVDYAGFRRPLDSGADAAFSFRFDQGSAAAFDLTGTVAGFRDGILGTDGVAPMRIGERREIVIPPALGYGFGGLRDRFTGDLIRNADGEILVPQCATLRFVVRVLDA